jgi:hypothetical protein
MIQNFNFHFQEKRKSGNKKFKLSLQIKKMSMNIFHSKRRNGRKTNQV